MDFEIPRSTPGDKPVNTEKPLPEARDFLHCSGGMCPLKGNCVRFLAYMNPTKKMGMKLMSDPPYESGMGKCSHYWQHND